MIYFLSFNPYQSYDNVTIFLGFIVIVIENGEMKMVIMIGVVIREILIVLILIFFNMNDRN